MEFHWNLFKIQIPEDFAFHDEFSGGFSIPESFRKDADTCPALSFALLALCLAPWSAAEDKTMEILWTWSQSLEGNMARVEISTK